MNKFIFISIAIASFGLLANLDNMIQIPNSETLELPLPLPYERTKVSKKALNDFIANVDSNKQAIVIFGANWCPDCRVLEGTLRIPTIKKFMTQNFEILHIDLGRYDINMELLEVLGIPKQEGVPRVVIFDQNGSPLNLDTNDEWRTARDRKQQDIFNYFQSFVNKS
tara:strand:+ start:17599 stop:18099 length:501 start_codon:yes stop_codon:yes gene_type:complete